MRQLHRIGLIKRLEKRIVIQMNYSYQILENLSRLDLISLAQCVRSEPNPFNTQADSCLGITKIIQTN